MTIPAEMRRRPPDATLAWVERSVGRGAHVVRVRRLRNAWAAVLHAVDVDRNGTRHRLVLRRYARAALQTDIGVIENEAAALGLVATAGGFAAPALVAFDVWGDETDVPSLLMTRLPGRDVVAPPDLDAFLDGLVATLHAIQQVEVPPGILNYFRPWGVDTVVDPPPWTSRPDVWERAIAVSKQPVPAHERVLCHRDFHPGNVLWQRGRVSGVVDWTSTCRGPAAADVAHCRVNLAILFGYPVAEEFARRFGPVDDLAWHDIADIVSLGDYTPEAWRWHDVGRTDITSEKMIAAEDELLAAAVSRLG